jgi:hypothetical protein
MDSTEVPSAVSESRASATASSAVNVRPCSQDSAKAASSSWVLMRASVFELIPANQGDVRPVHKEMTQAAGDRNVWLVGGGELVGQFADRRLLDEVLCRHRAGDTRWRGSAASPSVDGG